MAYISDLSRVLAWMFPDLSDETDYRVEEGGVLLWFTSSVPKPTELEVEAQRKPYWASVKRREIDTETELRSRSFMGEPGLTIGVLDFIERFFAGDETGTGVIAPAALQPAAGWNETWKVTKTLRDNRNTLLAQLESVVANPAWTAEQIRDFDVPGWNGWGVPRP